MVIPFKGCSTGRDDLLPNAALHGLSWTQVTGLLYALLDRSCEGQEDRSSHKRPCDTSQRNPGGCLIWSMSDSRCHACTSEAKAAACTHDFIKDTVVTVVSRPAASRLNATSPRRQLRLRPTSV